MVECHNCHFKNLDGMNFCGQCGHPLPPAKGAHPIDDTPPQALPAYALRQPRDYTPTFLLDSVLKSRHAMVGENKRVAILFADVVGITRIAEKTDPESLHRLMDGCFEILGEVVHGTGGTINQYTGDGIMAIFGAPIALEDYVARACFTALEIQRRLSNYKTHASETFGVNFQMRIGIHAGHVIVGAIGDNLRLDYTAVGDTTNLAARLQASASPGAIHVSKRVADAVDHIFDFKNIGTRHLKGKSRPQQIFQLLAEKTRSDVAVRSAGHSPVFMGRDKELAQLKAVWNRARDNGPASVMLIGPAGIGKTRLLTQLLDVIAKHPAFVLTGSCHAYGQSTAFQLLLEMLANTFSTAEQTAVHQALPVQHLISLTDRVLHRFNRIRKQVAYLDTLLDGRKRAIFSDLRELFMAAAAIQPCVIAIDNCQWLDSYSIEFLSDLSVNTNALPLLIICSGRWPKNQNVVHQSQLAIELGPIDDQSAIDLFATALGTKHVDLFLKRIAIDRAGGNPLFLIELAESLRRNNQLVIDKHRAFLKSPMTQLQLPSGVYDVLATRLDALPEAEKQLLQIAAVAGTDFSLHLLEKVADVTSGFFEGITALEQAAMIQRSSTHDDRYHFKQQMMRDVAYDMMLRQTRKRIHQKIGEALEDVQQDRLADVVGQLAYHFYMADQWSKALAYNLEAGHQARRVFACHTALVCFDRAAEILKNHPSEEHDAMLIRVLNWKGLMHYCAGQMKAALESFNAMLAGTQTGQNAHMAAEGLFRIGWIYFFLHNPRLAQKHLADARKQARKSGQSQIYLKATSFLGSLHLVLGKFQTARQLLMEARGLSQEPTGVEANAWTLASLIKHHNWTGEFEEALHLCEELDALNQQLHSRYFENFLVFQRGLIFSAIGQWRQAEAILEKGIAQWEAGDELFWRPRMLNTLAWVMALQNKPQDALALNRKALAEAMESGDPETIYNARINMVENFLQMNDLKQAKPEIEAVWKEIRYQRELYAIWRFKTRARLSLARLYLATGDTAAASRHAHGAYRTARDTGATKHQTMAMIIRARIIQRSNPQKAALLMDQALSLANKMKTPWLLKVMAAEKNEP